MTEENQEQEEQKTDFPKAGKDAELEAQRQAELDAERAEHQRRTAGESDSKA